MTSLLNIAASAAPTDTLSADMATVAVADSAPEIYAVKTNHFWPFISFAEVYSFLPGNEPLSDKLIMSEKSPFFFDHKVTVNVFGRSLNDTPQSTHQFAVLLSKVPAFINKLTAAKIPIGNITVDLIPPNQAVSKYVRSISILQHPSMEFYVRNCEKKLDCLASNSIKTISHELFHLTVRFSPDSRAASPSTSNSSYIEAEELAAYTIAYCAELEIMGQVNRTLTDDNRKLADKQILQATSPDSPIAISTRAMANQDAALDKIFQDGQISDQFSERAAHLYALCEQRARTVLSGGIAKFE